MVTDGWHPASATPDMTTRGSTLPRLQSKLRRREPRGHFFLGSALEIGLEKKFDLICVLYVFVHFVDDGDWLALIRRLAGQLTQGGSLLLADHFSNIEQRPTKHVCQRPLSRYETVLKASGLSGTATSTRGSQVPGVWEARRRRLSYFVRSNPFIHRAFS